MSKRDEIIGAAIRLAQTGGFRALSVRGVAREAGMGATTLRHYFPAQADLFRAIATEVVRVELGDLAIADDSQDPAQRLYGCLVQFLPPEEADRTVVLDAWFELHRLSTGSEAQPGVRILLQNGNQASLAVLRHWLTTLADQRHVRPDAVDAHARRALALINGLNLTMLLDPALIDVDTARVALRWFAEQVCSFADPLRCAAPTC